MKIAVLNGPNLGRLGQREPEIYGHATLNDLERELKAEFPSVAWDFFQSNHEGALIDQLEAWRDAGIRHVIMNPGALTHQSYALRDAVSALELLVIEVHLSNIYRREGFRAQSHIAPVSIGQISGLGFLGYLLAARYFVEMDDVVSSS